MASYRHYYGFAPYVPVAQRQAKAEKERKKLEKQGKRLAPVRLLHAGRTLCASWWGNAWCDNLFRFGDFENRLPRGRSYLRNGAVIDLQIEKGCVTALVQGTHLYTISISIDPLPPKTWTSLVADCSANITSLVDLMAGRFSDTVMRRLIRSGDGLFPEKREISFDCTCPDYANVCKHVAAVLMGIGVRFDEDPTLFFTLRGVDPNALVAAVAGSLTSLDTAAVADDDLLTADTADLTDLFDIDVEPAARPKPANRPEPKSAKRAVAPAKAPSLDADAKPKTAKPKNAKPKNAKPKNAKPKPKPAVVTLAQKPARQGKKLITVKPAAPSRPGVATCRKDTAPAPHAKRPTKVSRKPAPPPKPAVSPGIKSGVLMKSAELRALGLTQAEIRRAFFDGNLDAGPARGEYVTNRRTPAWLQAVCNR